MIFYKKIIEITYFVTEKSANLYVFLTYIRISGKIEKITLKGKKLMKTAKRLMILLPVLFLLSAALIMGCTHRNKSEVKDIIKSELDLLKNLDSETARKYISYKEFFPDAKGNTELSEEIKEVFSLFFRDFDYKILDISVDNKDKCASASLRLSTIDAHSLAKDFAASLLKTEILEAAQNASQDTKAAVSLEEHYLLLNHLLKTREYKTSETNCTIQLVNTGNTQDENWEIKRTHSLENDLVGGLMTYLSDPDILSPEDTLTVYLKTLKKMNLDEISNYLGVVSIMNASDPSKSSIASALAEQIHQTFNFKIKECNIEGYHAVVTTEITTFDSDAILTEYQKELDSYLASPDAVIDGSSKRYEKSLNVLLDCIKNNKATRTVEVAFILVNDGVSWKLQDAGTALGDAIFGILSISPVDEA